MDTDGHKLSQNAEGWKEHRVKNTLYRKAIIQAIDELHDFNLRSNIEAIRRHIQSTLGPEHIWNDTLFLKTMKALSNEGIIEQCASVNYGLSPEFKRRRTQSCFAAIEKKRLQHRHHSMPDNFSSQLFHHLDNREKEPPVKKSEHTKLKIIPKKIYEGLHVPLKNPMDTDRLEALWH